MMTYYAKHPSPITRLLVLSTFLLITATTTKGQCPGNTWLNTQDQVNAFAATYPNCQILLGDLFIGPWYDPQYAITDLSPLQNLQTIWGNLYISGQQLLTNLNGLHNLTTVNGSIYIEGNQLLTDLDELSGIVNYDGFLNIWNNPALTDLTGIANLNNRYLDITNNDALQNLPDFPRTSINGLTINGNDLLTNLDGFEALEQIIDQLVIEDSDALTDISALSGLSGNIDAIQIQYNQALEDLTPLSGLTSAIILYITDNDAIQNLNGLHNFSSISELHIGVNPLLSDISVFNNLTYCSWLHIYSCPLLTNLNSFGGITHLDFFDLGDLPSLSSLSGLSNLQNVQYFTIAGTGLTSLNDLSSLNNIEFECFITNNPQLSYCSIESVCAAIDGSISVEVYENAPGCNTPQEVKDNCTDTIPPTIVCPNYFPTVYANPGLCTYFLNSTALDPISWSDNLPGATLINNYNGYSTLQNTHFPSGTTTVVWTVTDQANNTASCSIQIVVIGQPCGWGTGPNGIGCNNGSATSYNVDTQEWTITSTNCFSQGHFQDSQAYLTAPFCGNKTITVQVTGMIGSGFAGIALRQSTNPNSKKVELTTNLSNHNRRAVRTTTGGTAPPIPFPSQNRYWLRLSRNGNQFTGFVSDDGYSWYLAFHYNNISMDNCLYACLVLSNKVPNGVVSATFANVQINTNNALAAWGGGNQTQGATNAENGAFDFFPNPASDEITLDLNQYVDKDVTLTVFNSLGQLVTVQALGVLQQTTVPFNLSPFKAGIYYLQAVTAEGRSAPQRLVVQPR